MSHDLYDIVDSEEGPVGMLYLQLRTLHDTGAVMTEVMLDSALLMSDENTISEEALATSALALHGGSGLRVLVGGLGLGYTAYAALASNRVAELEVVDRLPKVGEWLRAGRLPLSKQLGADERLTLTESDVYADLLGPPPARPWDVLLIDVDHAPRRRLSEASKPFYTVDGQRRVAQHLAPGGVLAVWSAARDDAFAEVLREVYDFAEPEYVSWTCPELGAMDNTLFLARYDA